MLLLIGAFARTVLFCRDTSFTVRHFCIWCFVFNNLYKTDCEDKILISYIPDLGLILLITTEIHFFQTYVELHRACLTNIIIIIRKKIYVYVLTLIIFFCLCQHFNIRKIFFFLLHAMGAWVGLHISLPLMNKLNQTESAIIFLTGCILCFQRISFSDYIYFLHLMKNNWDINRNIVNTLLLVELDFSF